LRVEFLLVPQESITKDSDITVISRKIVLRTILLNLFEDTTKSNALVTCTAELIFRGFAR